jgi:Na+-transporting methylmalonyl-CoA/oxaloacetate decarboxylase gamma subunit
VFTAKEAPDEEPADEEEDEAQAPPPPKTKPRRSVREELDEEEEPADEEEDEEEEERPRKRKRRPVDEDEEKEDEEERPRRRKRRGKSKAAARSMVVAPGICLMVLGVIGMVMSVLMLAMYVYQLVMGEPFHRPGGPPAGLPPDAVAAYKSTLMAFGIGGTIGSLISLGIQSLIFTAGTKLKNLESRGLVMTGSILALLCGPCCLGLPIGIWALVVINNPDVSRSFS